MGNCAGLKLRRLQGAVVLLGGLFRVWGLGFRVWGLGFRVSCGFHSTLLYMAYVVLDMGRIWICERFGMLRWYLATLGLGCEKIKVE